VAPGPTGAAMCHPGGALAKITRESSTMTDGTLHSAANDGALTAAATRRADHAVWRASWLRARALAAPRPRALVVGLWTLAAAFAGVQRLAEGLLLGRAGDAPLFRQDLWLLAMWALAAPAILWSARRFPVRGPSAARNAAVHLTAGTAFVVATNVLIRLPLLLPPASLAPWQVARDTLLGLARFYPAALIVYGVLVALGHWSWAASRAGVPAAPPADLSSTESAPLDLSVADATTGDSPATGADAGAAPGTRPERVVVREWNRVRLVRPEEIAWIEADDNYVVVHVGERTYKGRGRISDLETQLDPSCFVRVHRSAIVRVASIREVQPLTKGDLALVLHDGKVLRVARGRRAALEAALGVTL